MTRHSKTTAKPISTVRLRFRDEGEEAREDDPVGVDLSAAAFTGTNLWTANDELSHVERLSPVDGENYGHHKIFSLGDYLELPEGEEGEMDIEGLSADGGYLWVVGSHSATRKKPKEDEHDSETVLKRLSNLKNDQNRYFVGRFPVVSGPEHADYALAREGATGTGERLRAGCIAFHDKHGNELRKALRKDELIGPFCELPAKENGFDIEGIAARGNRVFLGLRGPVVRGLAIVIELELREGDGHELELVELEDDLPYRRHVLDLDGFGIRDMCWDGDDLLLVTGPTMDIPGRVTLVRWRNPLAATAPQVLTDDRLERVMRLPYNEDSDKPEGIDILERDGRRSLLVIYDSPDSSRFGHGRMSVSADLFEL